MWGVSLKFGKPRVYTRGENVLQYKQNCWRWRCEKVQKTRGDRGGDGVVIECNDTVANCPTMFTPTDEGYNIIDERERAITIDEFSFIRSSCKLILLDIPEEYWNTDENGDKYVCYQNEKIYKGKLIFEKNILNNIAP